MMGTWQRCTVASITIISALALSACSSGGEGDASDSGSTKKAKLVIGAVIPLTGDNATLGADLQRGIDLAVRQINKDGGVLGKALSVKVQDSEGTTSATVGAAKFLASVHKVPIVIGEYSSGNTIPMGQYLQQQGIVHINGGSSSPDIAKIGNFSFSTIGLDNVAGKFAADQLYAQGKRNIVLLAPDNAYGTGIATATEQAFIADGGRVAAKVLFADGKSDYRQELQRIQATKPDVVAYTAYGKDAQTINKNAFQLGMDTSKFYGIYLSQSIADSDPKVTNGQTGMEVNYVGPSGGAYQAAYKSKYGFDFKSSFSGYSYDAVMLAAKAIENAKSSDPKLIRQALAKLGKQGVDGVTGRITLDSNGQRVKQPYIQVQAVNGKVGQLK